MKENMVVGFLTAHDARNKSSWSGIFYYMWKALEQEFSEVVLLGPVKIPRSVHYLLSAASLLHKTLYHKKYNTRHSFIRSRFYARVFRKKLKQKKVDILFAPVAATEIACLNTSIPICYLSDTSFAQIRDYYTVFRGLSARSILESDAIEQAALDRAAVAVYSSSWAADFARDYYKARHATVIRFGANIDSVPDDQSLHRNYAGTIQFLFLGVDWERKGGDMVLRTLDLLIRKYPHIHLTVCGCVPPVTHSHMTVIPFLDKNKPVDAERFDRLMKENHLLFVPTRADCTPIIFCEANAYGMPVITTDTGGVRALITDGVNGFALPQEATEEDYARTVSGLLDDVDMLQALARSARAYYERELNWTRWGQKMRAVMMEVLTR